MHTGVVCGSRRPALMKCCLFSSRGSSIGMAQPRWSSGSVRIHRVNRWPCRRGSFSGGSSAELLVPSRSVMVGSATSGTVVGWPSPTSSAWPSVTSTSIKFACEDQSKFTSQSSPKNSSDRRRRFSKPVGTCPRGLPLMLARQLWPEGGRTRMFTGLRMGFVDTRDQCSLKGRCRGTGSSGVTQSSAQALATTAGPATETLRLEMPSVRQRFEFDFIAFSRDHIGASLGARCRGVWSPSSRHVKRPRPSGGRTIMGTVGLSASRHQVWQPPFSSWFCLKRQ
mmetsp:Transcript_125988/g.356268  ORF Transcript_125988/g.356268 Transcript_125988/m.356268 type:complete len:281 (+) Transcript_125988:1115-1957(+)